MSAATAADTHAVPRTQPARLLCLKRIGYAVLGVQLLAFMAWSTILYRRFALTFDFAVYHQAWYLIAHGNLDPYSSVSHLQFWRNDAEFAVWPLAPFYWIWPHDVVLLWLQDAAVVGAEAVAFSWLCELASRCHQRKDAVWLAGGGLVLLVANPWIWWAVSFDFHEEALAIPFAVLCARDIASGRRRAWGWLAPILAAGAPTASWVIGLGFGGMLAGRRSRLIGALMVLAGGGYSLLIVLFQADQGASLARHYGYLATGAAGGYVHAKLSTVGLAKGIASHPGEVVRALWVKRTDIIANLAPAGLLGVGFLPVLPLMLVVLLADTLSLGLRFAEPLFQALPIYVLLPAGTVGVLTRLAMRRRRTALLVAGILVAQTLGWAAVWGPRIPGQWLQVPAPAAVTLARIAARIPASAEVIASQGVIGRFSGRAAVHELVGPGTKPAGTGEIWLVIVPAEGIELQSTASAMAFIAELAGPLHATLVTHANGVWAFRWLPPPGVHLITVPGESALLPAWAAQLAPGGVGRPVLTGTAGTWHMASAGGKGYVADGLAWQEPAGRYQARVSLSATGPANVEVWDDTGNVLLARRSIPDTTGVESIALPVDARTAYRAGLFSGWGPFRADFVAPPPGQRLELRVWSPGGEKVNVYNGTLRPARGGRRSAGQVTHA